MEKEEEEEEVVSIRSRMQVTPNEYDRFGSKLSSSRIRKRAVETYIDDEHQQQHKVQHQQPQDELFILKRRVERVSKRAAMVSKRKIWDSNSVSIDLALSAVDRWEALYLWIKGTLQGMGSTLSHCYESSKQKAQTMEHRFLVPLRDYVLLPLVLGTEHFVNASLSFVQQSAPHVHHYTVCTLQQFPYVGNSVLAPLYQTWIQLLQELYTVLQYPIPSRMSVINGTDQALTAIKAFITATAQSLYTYAKMMDATVTRTLMHTQWRILKSGPYATLDPSNKQEVLDHICERYFSLHTSLTQSNNHSTVVDSTIARYEFIAHIKANNQRLYIDLVVKGLLHQRARLVHPYCGLLSYDVWLTSPTPIYRRQRQQHHPLIAAATTINSLYLPEIIPLWFYSPSDGMQEQGEVTNISNANTSASNKKNKKKRGMPWIPFVEHDMRRLEQSYRSYIMGKKKTTTDVTTEQQAHLFEKGKEYDSIYSLQESSTGPLCHAIYDSVISTLGLVPHSVTTNTSKGSHHQQIEKNEETFDINNSSIAIKAISCALTSSCSHGTNDTATHITSTNDSHHDGEFPYLKTVARWYEPDLSKDILVDQKRYAVSFLDCDVHKDEDDPLLSFTDDLSNSSTNTTTFPPMDLSLPSIKMLRRPTLWRFHGPGDEVRRATWFVETNCGLQPYCESSASILEDAYLFLSWYFSMNQRKQNNSVLLTVQVKSPDGEDQQLVQFASLTKITAVQKTLGGALSIFKSRVYRGACILRRSDTHAAKIAVSSDKSRSNSKIISDDMKELSVSLDQSVAVPITFSSSNKAMSVTRSKTIEYIHVAQNNAFDEDIVDHLVLVVHGIGEMMRSVDIFGLEFPGFSSLITCCDWMRINHAEVQSFQASDNDKTTTKNEGRVEYIPVEWHEAFALQSRRTPVAAQQRELACFAATHVVKDSPCLQHISLNTIPGLRSFVNDTLLDVLYFLSPEYHEKIISIVTNEMNLVFKKFLRLCGEGFSERVSIIGHSLGSVITWDILSHQEEKSDSFDDKGENTSSSPMNPEYERQNCNSQSSPLFHREISPRSVLLEPSYPQLCFQVCSTFMIGSPLSVFLMIRNQHQPMREDFTLPGCPRVFNIFHPYDPAAYRLEPLMNKYFSLVEPKLISHWRGGFRVQYRTKMVWNKIVEETRKGQRFIVGVVESAASRIGLYDNGSSDQEEEDAFHLSESEFNVDTTVTLCCGQLNQGRRIDYMLQEKEFENANEYVFAVGAHSGYWDEKDLSLFIAQELIKCKIDAEQIL